MPIILYIFSVTHVSRKNTKIHNEIVDLGSVGMTVLLLENQDRVLENSSTFKEMLIINLDPKK